MKIYKKELEIIKQRVVDYIKCDKCLEMIQFDYFDIAHTFGYETKYDSHTVYADICDNCLIKFIKTFKNRKIMEELDNV